MERRNAEDWDGVRLEALAQAYQEVRREMWTILGNRVGEKWSIVEAKVIVNLLPMTSRPLLTEQVYGEGRQESECCGTFSCSTHGVYWR